MNTLTPITWLLPVDGSAHALNAVRAGIVEARQMQAPVRFILLNVQSPLSKDISRFIDANTLDEYHRDNAEEALQSTKALLDASGFSYEMRVLLGEPAATIAECARTEHCARIVMGARGLGSVIGLLLGSITTKVVHLASVPVLLVK